MALIVVVIFVVGIYKGATWLISYLNKEVQQETVQNDANEEKPKEYIATVVLDPGHGDWDPGANKGNVYEKDITLTTAKAIGEVLEKENIKAVYTRETDVALSNGKIEDLSKRAQMSAQYQAQYFVSIHVNSYEDSDDVSGFEIYTKNDESKPLATSIGESVEALNYTRNRGLIDGGRSLQVLRDNTVPSILIELGYINNANDYAYLSDDAKLKILGEAIGEGIAKEIKSHKTN